MRMMRREFVEAALSAGVGGGEAGRELGRLKWDGQWGGATRRKLGGEIRPAGREILATLPK